MKVFDENDNPPLFKENSYEAEIAENSLAGTTVVPVSYTFYLYLYNDLLDMLM